MSTATACIIHAIPIAIVIAITNPLGDKTMLLSSRQLRLLALLFLCFGVMMASIFQASERETQYYVDVFTDASSPEEMLGVYIDAAPRLVLLIGRYWEWRSEEP